MKKFSLLLLDACVIIELCRLGLWGRVLEKCEILLARTVFDESFYYINDLGDKEYFSLDEDEKAGRLKVVEAPTVDVLDFKSQFNVLFGGEINERERLNRSPVSIRSRRNTASARRTRSFTES